MGLVRSMGLAKFSDLPLQFGFEFGFRGPVEFVAAGKDFFRLVEAFGALLVFSGSWVSHISR